MIINTYSFLVPCLYKIWNQGTALQLLVFLHDKMWFEEADNFHGLLLETGRKWLNPGQQDLPPLAGTVGVTVDSSLSRQYFEILCLTARPGSAAWGASGTDCFLGIPVTPQKQRGIENHLFYSFDFNQRCSQWIGKEVSRGVGGRAPSPQTQLQLWGLDKRLNCFLSMCNVAAAVASLPSEAQIALY